MFFFQFGIKSLKRGSVRNHQDFSQKTLIALVTSGLLLAFLGLAGYFLMKRRSWSPAGERLVSAYRWQNRRQRGGCPGGERRGLLRTPRLGTLRRAVSPQLGGTARPVRGAL